jgi:hypothetical protein
MITLFVPRAEVTGRSRAVHGSLPRSSSARIRDGRNGRGEGEQTANMLQPFWALPILAIAGLGIKDIMGYCVIALVVGVTLFGASLLIFA